MKIAVTFLIGLVCGVTGWMLFSRQPPGQPASMSVARTEPQPQTSAAPQPRKTNAVSVTAARFSWTSVESPDYAQYIANLRRIGCPEQTVRDIVVTDVCELFSKRRAAAQSTLPFWVPEGEIASKRAALDRELKQIDQEEGTVITKLLGIPWNGIEAYVGKEGADQISATKLARIEQMRRRLAEAEAGIQQKAGDNLSYEDQVRIRDLERQFESGLAGLLTPSELEEYQLRNSVEAANIRRHLVGFSLSESEFRDIYRSGEKFAQVLDQYADNYAGNADAQRVVADALAQHQQEIEQLLGSERYHDYERGIDNAYQRLAELAQSRGIDPGVYNQIYAYKEAIDGMQHSQTDEGQREALAAQKRAEAVQFAEQVLGPDGFQSYLQRGGDWLKQN